jgi:hypothetical protein
VIDKKAKELASWTGKVNGEQGDNNWNTKKGIRGL